MKKIITLVLFSLCVASQGHAYKVSQGSTSGRIGAAMGQGINQAVAQYQAQSQANYTQQLIASYEMAAQMQRESAFDKYVREENEKYEFNRRVEAEVKRQLEKVEAKRL